MLHFGHFKALSYLIFLLMLMMFQEGARGNCCTHSRDEQTETQGTLMKPQGSGKGLSLPALCLQAQCCLPCPAQTTSLPVFHFSSSPGIQERGHVNGDEEIPRCVTHRFGVPPTGFIASSVESSLRCFLFGDAVIKILSR